MSTTLTQQEREALEDVFLSIHTNKQKYEKLKEISQLLLCKNISYRFENLFTDLKVGIKQTSFSSFTTIFSKTKKHLRK
ncbi:MAG: hypothetical protein RBR59_02415 [Sulfurimonadaceae bacterium]|jgi:hypothetical protein|nr:hypothetical protein [Sulfurimonadaceae bacterium]